MPTLAGAAGMRRALQSFHQREDAPDNDDISASDERRLRRKTSTVLDALAGTCANTQGNPDFSDRNMQDMAKVAARVCEVATPEPSRAARRRQRTTATAIRNLKAFFLESSYVSRGDTSKFRLALIEIAGNGLSDSSVGDLFSVSRQKTARRARGRRTARAASGESFALVDDETYTNKRDLTQASAFYARVGVELPGKSKHTRMDKNGKARLDKSGEWKDVPDAAVWDCGKTVELGKRKKQYLKMTRLVLRDTQEELYAAFLTSPEYAAHTENGGGRYAPRR